MRVHGHIGCLRAYHVSKPCAGAWGPFSTAPHCIACIASLSCLHCFLALPAMFLALPTKAQVAMERKLLEEAREARRKEREQLIDEVSSCARYSESG